MLAGAAMAFSSVFVVGNSLRLRTFQSRAIDTPARAGKPTAPAEQARQHSPVQ
jgi:Cu+-exporting ATPase